MQQFRSDNTAPRYSVEAARQILASAQSKEPTEIETLSADQIETLGRELGISTYAIRRAMSEVNGSMMQNGTLHRNRAARLTVSQVARIPVPGLLYGILLTILFSLLAGTALINLYVSYVVAVGILPLVGSFFFGCLARDQRVAVLTGGLLSGLAFTGAHLGMMINSDSSHYWITQSALGIVASLVGCIVLAAGGNYVGTRYLDDK